MLPKITTEKEKKKRTKESVSEFRNVKCTLFQPTNKRLTKL